MEFTSFHIKFGIKFIEDVEKRNSLFFVLSLEISIFKFWVQGSLELQFISKVKLIFFVENKNKSFAAKELHH
jgi:hypothetical protein